MSIFINIGKCLFILVLNVCNLYRYAGYILITTIVSNIYEMDRRVDEIPPTLSYRFLLLFCEIILRFNNPYFYRNILHINGNYGCKVLNTTQYT